MPRSKSPSTSAEITAEIARLRRDSEAQLRQLEARRRELEARENQRRGEIIMEVLAGEVGNDLRTVLQRAVQRDSASLFGIDGLPNTGTPQPRRTRSSQTGETSATTAAIIS